MDDGSRIKLTVSIDEKEVCGIGKSKQNNSKNWLVVELLLTWDTPHKKLEKYNPDGM